MRILKENLLTLYYTRGQIEKIFELCKQDGKILPPECGSNILRASDDDIYGCNHTKVDVRQIKKNSADNGFHVYEPP